MSSGLYLINNKDAFDTYGVLLDYESLGGLMAPPPLKDAVENDAPLENGVQQSSVMPKVNKRTLTLIFHLYANSQEQALSRYNAFVQLLISTPFKLKVIRTNLTFHLVYKSSSSFVPWFDGVAKFTLSVVEPNPTKRT